MTLPWLKIAGGAGGVLLAAALFQFAGSRFVAETGKLIDKGAAMADARWQSELRAVNAEHAAALLKAQLAGDAEAARAIDAAEARADGAERALRKERARDATFDEALRVSWPDDYFDSVCGQRPGCRPPD